MDKIYTLIAAFYTGMYDRDESEDRGAGMVEYALLVALVGVLLIGTHRYAPRRDQHGFLGAPPAR